MAKKRYSDLDLDFNTHPVSGDITFKYNDEAVKRSIRNLIFMGTHEKPFHPEIKSNIRKLLFENFTPVTAFEVEKEIEDIINEYEPRAKIISVDVMGNTDYNGENYLDVTLNFRVVGIPNQLFDMSMALKRAR